MPKIVHAFGRSDQVDREVLARLCRSIARVCGLEVRDLMKEGRKAASDRALPDGVTQVETRSLGAVWVIEALWERFGIGEELRRIERESKCKVPYERALFAMTANRLCEPASKLGVWEERIAKVHVPSCSGLKLAQMYEAMDLLHRHMARVEEDDEEGLRHFGHSKEGGGSAQVKVALAVTREGLLVRSWVFPGDTSDVETVETVKKDLRYWKLGRALFAADSGMNSSENRSELARACGTYLLACRAGSVKEVQKDVLCRPGRYKVIADNPHVKEVVVGKVVVSQDAIRKAERMDGKWVLITNDDTLSVEDAAIGYRNLLVIERCFRTMKTAQIRMDPVYHWLPRRIEAHVKICALALLIQRVAELGVGMPWRRIADALGHLQATEYRTDSHRFFQRNEVRPEVRRILKTLKIPEPNEVLAIAPRAEKP